MQSVPMDCLTPPLARKADSSARGFFDQPRRHGPDRRGKRFRPALELRKLRAHRRRQRRDDRRPQVATRAHHQLLKPLTRVVPHAKLMRQPRLPARRSAHSPPSPPRADRWSSSWATSPRSISPLRSRSRRACAIDRWPRMSWPSERSVSRARSVASRARRLVSPRRRRWASSARSFRTALPPELRPRRRAGARPNHPSRSSRCAPSKRHSTLFPGEPGEPDEPRAW